jgi:prepilin-type N-terminal cleavage/methylation domain-containing protein
MNTKHSRSAFTLVELIMVIVIMGLLAAVVIPKYGDIRTEAQTAAETGTVSAVTSGIKLVHMTNLAKGQDTWPSVLDTAANGVASAANPLFADVIEDGVTDGNWQKIGARTYRYNPTTDRYVYDRVTGKFTKQ